MESGAIGDVWVMDIFQGIVIGVFIGVFSGLTLWLLELGKNRFWVRRDQIQYLHALIMKARKTIYSATDLSKPFRTEEVVSKHDVRVTLYRAMRRDLSAVLEGRASQLSFDEKASITSPCIPIDWVTETHNKLPPFQLYTTMFSEWEKQAWLNLPAYDGEIPEE